MSVITTINEKPELPTNVTVTYNNETSDKKAVTWDKINPNSYKKVGTFIVKGTIIGSKIKAVAKIKVVKKK